MKYRKISNCKSRINHDVIISMLKQQKSYSIIAKKVGMCEESISVIAKENNLRYKVVRADIKRNERINKLILKGLKYDEIANKFNVSKQRIQQFAKQLGVKRWEDTRAYYKNTIEKINLDIANGLTYNEILKKHNISDNRKLRLLYRNGLISLLPIFREKRNNTIVSEFADGKTATEIITSKNKKLNDPTKINNINTVYRINTKAGMRRQPKVGNRSKGGTFEKSKILEFIKLKRDKNKYSFREIAEVLNKKGLKTIGGKIFTEYNVFAKYKI